jgi:hypothetical protein
MFDMVFFLIISLISKVRCAYSTCTKDIIDLEYLTTKGKDFVSHQVHGKNAKLLA